MNAVETDFYQRFDFITQNLRQRVKAEANAKYPYRNAEILDIGCGDGRFMRELKKYGYKIQGIDVEQKCADAKIMDAEKMTFADKSFDGIIAMNIIEHLKNPERFLEKIRRMLKVGGICIISTPNTTWLRGLFKRNPIHPEHLQYWNYGKFKTMMWRNGFEIIDQRWIGRIPFLTQCDTFILAVKG